MEIEVERAGSSDGIVDAGASPVGCTDAAGGTNDAEQATSVSLQHVERAALVPGDVIEGISVEIARGRLGRRTDAAGGAGDIPGSTAPAKNVDRAPLMPVNLGLVAGIVHTTAGPVGHADRGTADDAEQPVTIGLQQREHTALVPGDVVPTVTVVVAHNRVVRRTNTRGVPHRAPGRPEPLEDVQRAVRRLVPVHFRLMKRVVSAGPSPAGVADAAGATDDAELASAIAAQHVQGRALIPRQVVIARAVIVA